MYKDAKKLLSDAKFYEGYSRFDDTLGRYETWTEAVDRVMNMHIKHYALTDKDADLMDYINEATIAYKNKLVLGAQRALQFGGEQLLTHQMRMYNCTSSYVDRPEFFGEIFYIMLCGAGAGFSVQKHHIAKLPSIVVRTKQPKIHVVEDSIEGWSTALDVLLSSYFETGGKHPEYKGHRVYFDLSKVRPKGAKISGGFKAPGPDPLRLALDRIEHILQGEVLLKKKTQLRPIHAYDIVMHAADSVLAGGVRRSATIALFSPDDEEMLNAKTGNWFIDNPQRARSNNSALIVRNDIDRATFDNIIEKIKEFGEPGFVFTESTEHMVNPCVSGNTVLRVKDHDIIENGKLVAVGSEYNMLMKDFVNSFNYGGLNPLVLSYNFETKQAEYMPVSAAALTRKMANVIKIVMEDGKELVLTPDHKVYTTNRGWIEAKDLTETDDLILETKKSHILKIIHVNNEDVYDITVPKSHSFFADGILVHNCVEIGMYPQIDSISGWQGCNLTEINGGILTDEDMFYKACRAASILGTLQAGYTDFKFLTDASKKIFDREALLGVSITGWMANPELLFNEEIQRKGAQIVLETNKKVAKLLGINPAARTTCCKPSGNACTTFDTLIKTENGLMTLGDIFNHCSDGHVDVYRDVISVDTSFGIAKELRVLDENNELQDITGLYFNGIARVIEVEFEDGKVYKFTDHHKLKTTKGWKYVCDLTENDEIIDF